MEAQQKGVFISILTEPVLPAAAVEHLLNINSVPPEMGWTLLPPVRENFYFSIYFYSTNVVGSY